MSLPSYNKYDKINMQLRRNEVMKYATMGLSQSEIAEKVGVTQACVSLDLQYWNVWQLRKYKQQLL